MNHSANHKTNLNTLRLLVVLFALFLVSLYIKDRFTIKEKAVGEPEQIIDTHISPTADTALPKISPIPQDPNKPKLTDDFLKKQVNSDIFKYIPAQTNGILSYIENETNKDQSGRIGKYNYLIKNHKPTEDRFVTLFYS